jgi:hypothetical protein
VSKKPKVKIYTFRVSGAVIYVVQGGKNALDICEELFDKYEKAQ